MNVRKNATALAAALVIGTALLGSTTPVLAVPKDGDGEVQCTYTYPDGEITYHPIGTRLWDKFAGKYRECGKDGKWHMEGGAQSPVSKPTGGVKAQ